MSLVKDLELIVHTDEGVKESTVAFGDRLIKFSRQVYASVEELYFLVVGENVGSNYTVIAEMNGNNIMFSLDTGDKCVDVASTDHSVMRRVFESKIMESKVSIASYSVRYTSAYHSLMTSSLGFINYLNESGCDPSKFVLKVVNGKCVCVELYI